MTVVMHTQTTPMCTYMHELTDVDEWNMENLLIVSSPLFQYYQSMANQTKELFNHEKQTKKEEATLKC